MVKINKTKAFSKPNSKSKTPIKALKDVDNTAIHQSKTDLVEKSKSKQSVPNILRKTKNKGKLLFEKTIAPKKFKNKKEKQKLKHKNLENKFELIRKQKSEQIAQKKREKTKITGDLKPLKDALPSLDELFKLNKHEIKSGIKDYDDQKKSSNKPKNKNERIKKRQKEYMDRYNCFASMMKDKNYKQNARDLIAFHVQALKNNADS